MDASAHPFKCITGRNSKAKDDDYEDQDEYGNDESDYYDEYSDVDTSSKTENETTGDRVVSDDYYSPSSTGIDGDSSTLFSSTLAATIKIGTSTATVTIRTSQIDIDINRYVWSKVSLDCHSCKPGADLKKRRRLHRNRRHVVFDGRR